MAKSDATVSFQVPTGLFFLVGSRPIRRSKCIACRLHSKVDGRKGVARWSPPVEAYLGSLRYQEVLGVPWGVLRFAITGR